MLSNESFKKHELSNNLLPVTFAEFDLLKHVKMQKQILRLYTSNSIWTSPTVQAQNFMTCMPWTVTRNAFYPIFKRGLGQFFESGLYARWDNFHDDINGMSNLYDIEKKLEYQDVEMENVAFPVEKRFWRNYYFHSKKFPDQEQLTPVPHAVTLQVFKVVWILVGILICLAIFSILMEFICHNLSNTERNIYTHTYCC